MWRIKEKWRSIPQTVKVSVAYAVCSIIQRFLSFFTLPLFTRLLSKAQYGQYLVYTSWTGIFSIFLTLNLAYGSFSTAMVKYDNDRDGYISSIQGIFLALTSLFLFVYYPFRKLWNDWLGLPTFLVITLVAETVFQNCFLLWCGKQRFEFKYKGVIGLTLLSSFLMPFISYILVSNTDEKGYARIVGCATVNISIGLVIFIIECCKGKKLFDVEYWRYALKFNVPLIIYYLSQYIFGQSDRLVISRLEGDEKAAVYGVAYNLAIILTFVLNAINNAYVPWFYLKVRERKEEDNKKVANGIAVLMATLLSAVIWFAPEIIVIMAGEQYKEATYVVAPVAISMIPHFYSQLFINMEIYFEEKKTMINASVISAVINILLNLTFIKLYGYMAAAYTTLASYIVFCLLNMIGARKTVRMHGRKDVAYDYRFLFTTFVLFTLLSLCGVLLYRALIVRLLIMLIIATLFMIKRNYFYNLYLVLKENSKS